MALITVSVSSPCRLSDISEMPVAVFYMLYSTPQARYRVNDPQPPNQVLNSTGLHFKDGRCIETPRQFSKTHA